MYYGTVYLFIPPGPSGSLSTAENCPTACPSFASRPKRV